MAQTKTRRLIEPRWVSEYVVMTYPPHIHRFGVPLGPIPDELTKAVGTAKAIRQYRPWRPEADALVIMPKRMVLLEGKVFKYMDGLSKLPFYKSLIPRTPELQEYLDREVQMVLLLPVEIDWVRIAALDHGVDVVVWCPDWLRPIWEERDKYWSKENMFMREKRKEVLRELGY